MKKGWQTKNLGDLCDVVGGGTPPKDKPAFYSGDIPWATVRDMRQDVITETEFRITKDAVKSSATNIIPSGNVVIATRVGLGKVCLIGQDTAINQDLRGIVPHSEKTLVVRFLYWWLKSIADVIVAEGTGATVQGVKLPFVKSLQIPVPPLAEQQRIVGLLDEAFEGLATAKANAEKNLQNARALFESHLQSVFTQRGPGWVEKSLGETCEMYQPKTIGTKDLVPDGPYSVFGANGVIGRYDKFNHEEAQLLVTCRGATCGSVNISEPNSWITGNAMVVRPKDHALDLHFLEFVFRGGIDISAAITGAAQPQITRTNLSPLLIRFPKSVTEQTRLAEKFEDLAEETQRLARLYEQKLAALEALKKSLLHQAFTGELL